MTKPPTAPAPGIAPSPVPDDDTEARGAVRMLLRYIGEDPERPGLEDTPDRVRRAWLELTSGYDDDPSEILSTTFDLSDVDPSVSYGGIVALGNVEFSSLCEHHILPFEGTVDVAYHPPEGGEVVGLSKLARLVDCFARRLQCQERMTAQIAASLSEHLEAKGVYVRVEAVHSCMKLRGVRKRDPRMVTVESAGTLSDPDKIANLTSLFD